MTALFVRNENGCGYKPTARGMILLRTCDVLGLVAFVGFCAIILQPGDTPWWAIVLVAPFAIAPLFWMMLFTGRGPIGALLHYARSLQTQHSTGRPKVAQSERQGGNEP